MHGFILRMLITAGGLALAAWIVPGITFTSPLPLIIAALLLGFVNAFVRPFLVLITLPLTIVTLGLFLLVLNALMFSLVAWILPGFSVSGFFAALFGWLIVFVVGWVASAYIGPSGRYELMVVERHRVR